MKYICNIFSNPQNGTVHSTKQALENVGQGGVIVNVSSVAGEYYSHGVKTEVGELIEHLRELRNVNIREV